MESIVYKNFKAFFDSLNISVNAFSKVVGIPQRTLNNYVSGDRVCTIGLITSVLKAYPQLSAEWLLRGDGSMFKTTLSDTEKDFEIQRLRAQIEILQDTLIKRDQPQQTELRKSV